MFRDGIVLPGEKWLQYWNIKGRVVYSCSYHHFHLAKPSLTALYTIPDIIGVSNTLFPESIFRTFSEHKVCHMNSKI